MAPPCPQSGRRSKSATAPSACPESPSYLRGFLARGGELAAAGLALAWPSPLVFFLWMLLAVLGSSWLRSGRLLFGVLLRVGLLGATLGPAALLLRLAVTHPSRDRGADLLAAGLGLTALALVALPLAWLVGAPSEWEGWAAAWEHRGRVRATAWVVGAAWGARLLLALAAAALFTGTAPALRDPSLAPAEIGALALWRLLCAPVDVLELRAWRRAYFGAG